MARAGKMQTGEHSQAAREAEGRAHTMRAPASEGSPGTGPSFSWRIPLTLTLAGASYTSSEGDFQKKILASGCDVNPSGLGNCLAGREAVLCFSFPNESSPQTHVSFTIRNAR